MSQTLIQFRHVRTAMVALTLLCFSLCSCSDNESRLAAESSIPIPLAFRIVADDYSGSGMTRGTPSEELEESAGIYAHTYEEADAWDNGGGTPPDFMVNEEMQFAGDKWLTVSTFDKMPADRFIRFYAYYPHGLDPSVLEVSDENRENAPLLVYTVPESVDDQKDILAGSSIDADGHIKVFSTNTQNGKDGATPEDVTLKLSHLLTAVKFQIGECIEAGRIKKITLTNILGKNQYSMQRDADDNYFEGWDNTRSWGGSYDDDYRDFSIDLNKQIRLTQRDGEDVVPQEVSDGTQWLLMIPQVLSEQTELHVIYNSGGSDHEMVAEMDGKEWLQGKRVVYTLNINSLQRLTVNSAVLPWGTGLNFTDGQPTNATNLSVQDGLDDWTTQQKDIYSDDTPEGEWQ